MSVTSGVARKHDGTAIDYVSIFNWADGKCIAQVIPDEAGNWSYEHFTALRVGIAYIADGCAPITHGAYDFIPEVINPADLFVEHTGLWFDAADAASITIVDNKISVWNDKSNGAQHASQSNASLRPTYDSVNKGVVATGLGEALKGTFNAIASEKINEYTMYAVVSPIKTTASTSSESNSGAVFYERDHQHNVFFEAKTANTARVSPVFSATTQSFVATETRSGIAPVNISKRISMHGSGKVLLGVTRKNNAELSTRVFGELASATSSSTIAMGWDTFMLPAQYTGDSKFNGSIHELLLIHNGVLGLDVIQKVEYYLASKWGITDKLV